MCFLLSIVFYNTCGIHVWNGNRKRCCFEYQVSLSCGILKSAIPQQCCCEVKTSIMRKKFQNVLPILLGNMSVVYVY